MPDAMCTQRKKRPQSQCGTTPSDACRPPEAIPTRAVRICPEPVRNDESIQRQAQPDLRSLDRRTALGANGRHPLFCTLKGRPMQSVYVRNLMMRLGHCHVLNSGMC